MKTHLLNPHAFTRWLTAALLALGTTTWSAETSALKDVFKDQFLVGTAINRSIATGASFRRSPEQVSRDIALVKEHFNQVVAENDMKWALIHPREGSEGYDFGPADAFVNFGLSHRMELAGHTLVWHAQTPNWVFAGTNPPPVVSNAAPGLATDANAPGTNRARGGRFGPYNGPRASREELLHRMRDHIHTVVGRYQGKIKVWDVVNEAIADGGTNILRNSLWREIIGPDFIAKAFEYAHEADPGALLRYNDYGLENPAKRRKLIALIKSLQEQKVPVMAIGSQAHLNVSTSFEAMDQALAEMATLGLPIHITELDVNSAAGGQRTTGADVAANASATQGGLVDDANRRLAEAYAGIFRAFLKHDKSVEMVTFWGANDANSWRASGKPLLFDGNSQPKPAFHAVIAEVKKAAPARWTSLFNGLDLSGWSIQCQPQDQGKVFWTVADGSIVCDSMGRKDHNYVWLLTEKEFTDFELRLQFQAYKESPGNSGLQFRSRFDATASGGWLDGPQVDIHPPGPMNWRTGLIYDETREEKRWISPSLKDWNMEARFKPESFVFKYAEDGDGWNDLILICQGNQVKTVLNGVVRTDWDGAGVLDNASHARHNVGRAGHFALQLHAGDELRIRFRDIRIMEL